MCAQCLALNLLQTKHHSSPFSLIIFTQTGKLLISDISCWKAWLEWKPVHCSMRSGHYMSVKCLFVAPGSELTTNIYNCVFTLCTEDKWIGTHKLLTRTKKKSHKPFYIYLHSLLFSLHLHTETHQVRVTGGTFYRLQHFSVIFEGVCRCKPSLGGKFCQGGSKKVLFNAATNINKRKDPVPEVGLLSPPHKA